jgi:hypothetical protein
LSSATCLQNAGRMEGHLNNSKGFAPLSLLSALLMNPKHFSLSLSLSLFLSPSKLHFKFLGFIFPKKKKTETQPENQPEICGCGNARPRVNSRPCGNPKVRQP